MIYILGASGFLGKKVSKLFNKRRKILISSKKKILLKLIFLQTIKKGKMVTKFKSQ